MIRRNQFIIPIPYLSLRPHTIHRFPPSYRRMETKIILHFPMHVMKIITRPPKVHMILVVIIRQCCRSSVPVIHSPIHQQHNHHNRLYRENECCHIHLIARLIGNGHWRKWMIYSNP